MSCPGGIEDAVSGKHESDVPGTKTTASEWIVAGIHPRSMSPKLISVSQGPLS
jgi:hypothetical protein